MASAGQGGPPPTMEYGGDEVGALVLDPGTETTRAGFAGEDLPKRVIASQYGYIPPKEEGKEGQYFLDDINVLRRRGGMEVKWPIQDGIVEDWDGAARIWKEALVPQLCESLAENPLIVTEPAWNPVKNREKTTELMFEQFDVPAFYLARSAVCAAFANGKSTCLVVDVGHSNVSVTPVYDGLILKKGTQKTPLGGAFINHQCRAVFAQRNPPIDLTPYNIIDKRARVDMDEPAHPELRKFPEEEGQHTASWLKWCQERLLHDFKESVVQTYQQPSGSFSEQHLATQPPRLFEFPTGFNTNFGSERYRIAETMFQPTLTTINPDDPLPFDPTTIPSIGQIVKDSLQGIDVDVRQTVLANVVVVGGGSLQFGFTDRLQNELQSLYPTVRVKIYASMHAAERKYAGFLGGSILASLGTFHQLWISRREYDEHGAGIVEKRCK